jgi:lipopolysaccharide biosynthesis glycosyltransferase
MLIPAFFVADAVRKQSAAAGSDFDVIVVVPPSDVTAEHRQFAAARGILIDDTVNMTSIQGVVIAPGRLSHATLVKLLLAGHFQNHYRRIIYLDSDLIIHGNVSALFRLDMGEFAIAAVPSGRIWLDRPDAERKRAHSQFQALGMTPPYRFFNTGMMLIDCGRWIREKVLERAIAFLEQNPDLCSLPDEDSLNAVIDGHLLELSPIWNSRPERLQNSCPLPVITHYLGNNKPWRRFQEFKRLFEHRAAYRLYAEFIRETPWPNWLRTQWTVEDLIGSLRHELRVGVERIRYGSILQDPARRAAFASEIRRFNTETRFADVEQGIVLRHDDCFRLA